MESEYLIVVRKKSNNFNSATLVRYVRIILFKILDIIND